MNEIINIEPVIKVGIMAGRAIKWRPSGTSQWHTALYENRDVLVGAPVCTDGFELDAVTIGRDFHWERKERQCFEGALRFVADDGALWAVSDVPLEAYLKSVISSEMNAEAPVEFLKAHAVASRSWLLRQLQDAGKHPQGQLKVSSTAIVNGEETEEICCWHDREDHTLFDVCADDHCQRYQGVSRQTSPQVAHAVHATRGMVLTYGGRICDARFSKCCGGRTELFRTCWENASHPYLVSVEDPYCHRATPEVLAQVLNNYDRENPGHDCWVESVDRAELEKIIEEKSGMRFGRLLDLQPLHRGPSGRIDRLLVRGEKRSVVVGKELEIRRWLSPTHLRSSWFDVEINREADRVEIKGHGWGHGVGLCQIGAAQMAVEGKNAGEILKFYFPDSELTGLYQ